MLTPDMVSMHQLLPALRIMLSRITDLTFWKSYQAYTHHVTLYAAAYQTHFTLKAYKPLLVTLPKGRRLVRGTYPLISAKQDKIQSNSTLGQLDFYADSLFDVHLGNSNTVKFHVKMSSNSILVKEKTGCEVSSIGNHLPSSMNNETSTPVVQDGPTVEAEADYPHGIRLVFVVVALILSMFLVRQA